MIKAENVITLTKLCCTRQKRIKDGILKRVPSFSRGCRKIYCRTNLSAILYGEDVP